MAVRPPEQPRPFPAFLLSLLLASGVCWLDGHTKADYGIASLYYLTIVLSGWWGNRTTGLMTALICTLLEVYTNASTGAYMSIPVALREAAIWWGIVLHFAVYLGISATLNWIKGLLTREHQALEREEAAKEAEMAAKDELLLALKSVRELEGMLPICAWCKKIRDDAGFWVKVEGYIMAHTKAKLTHGVCPDCKKQFFDGSEPIRKLE